MVSKVPEAETRRDVVNDIKNSVENSAEKVVDIVGEV